MMEYVLKCGSMYVTTDNQFTTNVEEALVFIDMETASEHPLVVMGQATVVVRDNAVEQI